MKRIKRAEEVRQEEVKEMLWVKRIKRAEEKPGKKDGQGTERAGGQQGEGRAKGARTTKTQAIQQIQRYQLCQTEVLMLR